VRLRKNNEGRLRKNIEGRLRKNVLLGNGMRGDVISYLAVAISNHR
jgi:hypothetical protein